SFDVLMILRTVATIKFHHNYNSSSMSSYRFACRKATQSYNFVGRSKHKVKSLKGTIPQKLLLIILSMNRNTSWELHKLFCTRKLKKLYTFQALLLTGRNAFLF